MVDVAEINPPVSTLPPVMLAVTETTEPNILDAVTLPVELINPPVNMFPPVMLPVVLTTLLPRLESNVVTLPLP